MRLEVFIGRKLSLKSSPAASGRKKKQTAPGVKIAVAGIALSFVIMLVSIAVVDGFKKEITKKVTGFEQQISIAQGIESGDFTQNIGIQLNDTLIDLIHSVAPEASIALTLSQPAILKTDDAFEGLLFKGLDLNGQEAKFINESIIDGTMSDFNDDQEYNPLIISKKTANSLKLKVDDDIMAHFFIANNLLSRKMKVKAIYDTHFGDFDKLIAYPTLSLLQKLNKIDSITGTALVVNGLPMDSVDFVSAELRRLLIQKDIEEADEKFYHVQNINVTGAQYFNWLSLLDTNVLVILILMGCVSGFTLVSSLFIIILQRVQTIGQLKALGATNMQIRKIFVFMASRILITGLIIGNILGLGFLWLQSVERIIPLDADAYYLNYVPVSISTQTVLCLNASIVLISFILLIIPSQIIAKISPANTMRYE